MPVKKMFVDTLRHMMSSVVLALNDKPIDDTNDTNGTSPDEGTSVSLVLPTYTHRRLKAEAALAGAHLKTYLLGILEAADTRGAP